MKNGLVTLVLFLFTGGILFAQQTVGTPQVISYQGAVGTIDGLPLVDGEYPITVTLYADAGGAIKVWRDTYTASIRSGIFNIYLGSGNVPLPPPAQMDKALWIGTQIAGGEEMRPLTRLSASPYAINVPDAAITTSKLADGAVTEEKVGMDYISGVSVNGKKVAISGKVLNIQAGKDIDIHYDDITQSLIIGSPARTGADEDKDASHGRRLQAGPLDAWAMGGDGVTIPGAAGVVAAATDFIGTNAGNTPFTVKVNGQRVMVYQPNFGVTPSIIGGHVSNTSAAGGTGNTIAGGGGPALANTIDGIQYNVISGGADNHVYNTNASFGVVAGGQENTIGTAATLVNYGVIGGGLLNQVTATYGTIGGGNRSAVSGVNSTVGGGIGNIISGSEATIAGGDGNTVNAPDGAIGGGYHHQITGTAAYGTIAGGSTNLIDGQYGAIGGGGNQSILNANSIYGTIAGGGDNAIGTAAVPATYGTVGGGQGNLVTGNFGVVGGGQTNQIFGVWSTISGGFGNGILNPGSSHGAIGGGQWNTIGTAASVVGYGVIGGGLLNQVTATYGTIGGGNRSVVSGVNSTVGGGIGNLISGTEATIAGGDGNQVIRQDGAIGGGYHNQIVGTADYGTIAGGATNILNGQYGAISGGQDNRIIGNYGAVGGGQTNQIAGPWGVIGGGVTNNILNVNSAFGVIAGGQSNQIGTAAALANYGVIGGGLQNQVTATYGTIGGGNRSVVSGVNSTVGGGIGNLVSGTEATIAGGDGNQVTRRDGAIAGGYRNQIVGSADYGTIAGGNTNIINGEHDFVGGGQGNSIAGPWGVISGGYGNGIQNAGSSHGAIGGGQWNTIGSAVSVVGYGVIGGGLQNQVTATYGTIGGGNRSVVSGVNSTVGGGIGNLISGTEATIAGGDGNQVGTLRGSIGGGYHNTINGAGFSAAIPGGENLTAQSYGQAVVGVLNIPKGTVLPGGAPNDEPIFIVGNGLLGVPSNAFEVSYNGHSTVFQNTLGATPSVFGGTFADNVILSWGSVDATGGRVCDFGVANVTHLGTGWYQIDMNVVDPDGNPLLIGCGSVTATIAEANGPGSPSFNCAVISVSQIKNSQFDVHISDVKCGAVDLGFNFKVTGRP